MSEPLIAYIPYNHEGRNYDLLKKHGSRIPHAALIRLEDSAMNLDKDKEEEVLRRFCEETKEIKYCSDFFNLEI